MSKWIKKTSWLGDVYWEDEKGNRIYERTDWLGNKYEEDSEGKRYYYREDWLGNTYKEDEEGNRVYLREDWFGNKYWEDEKGNRIYERKDWLGNDIRDEGGCFITTACLEAKGLPDDCPELNTFRMFRDEYIKNLPTGERLIAEYYAIAPRIMAAINRTDNKRKIYSALYERLVAKTIDLINSGKKEEALRNCIEIVTELKQKYL